MRRLLVVGATVVATLSLAVTALIFVTGVGASPAPSRPSASFKRACDAAPAGYAACHALVRMNAASTGANGISPLAASPGGLNPADLISAYKITSGGSGTQTVAIVDAYNDPNAESDLAVYRSTFGLPACTTANGCFRKVNQNGVQGSYPRNNVGWSEEISLDLDMVSAICPNCHILLVEARNNSFANLAAAVDRAAIMGAKEISNSYSGSEYSTETSDQSHYNHPGIMITVSSGDAGYGVEFPAAS